MTHLDQEQIQRLLHGELNANAHALVHEHLAECADCRARIDQARGEEAEILTLLETLDHPAPHTDVRMLMQRARPQRTSLRWAAAIVVTLGAAGAAVAIPGSPLRTWLRDRGEVETPQTQPHAANPDGAAGIAVALGDRLFIEFESPQSRGIARVQLSEDGDVVSVRSLNGSATFTSGADRLLIHNATTGDFEIQIPRWAPHVEILVGGRRLLLKDAGRVTTDASADRNGVFMLSLTLTAAP